MLRAAFHSRSPVNLRARGAGGAHAARALGPDAAAMEAAARYRDAGLPVVLVAGERYGTGSSRDWAAKGQRLLGIRAVLALSFERIHRSNLIGMGILPLRLPPQWGPSRLQLAPGDRIDIDAPAALRPRARCRCACCADGGQLAFEAIAAVETQLETTLLAAGGVMPRILRQALDTAPERPDAA